MGKNFETITDYLESYGHTYRLGQIGSMEGFRVNLNKNARMLLNLGVLKNFIENDIQSCLNDEHKVEVASEDDYILVVIHNVYKINCIFH